MDELEHANSAQRTRDQEAYQVWKMTNNIARITLLNYMTMILCMSLKVMTSSSNLGYLER